MSRTGAEIRQSEMQSKFIQDRITKVEKHFGEFCENIAGFSRKISKVRNKGDDISRSIMTYAENESHNPTTKMALSQFAENFSAVQDYREAEIQRLDNKVVAPLTTYGHSCKLAKERLKTAFSARKKEIAQKEKLDKVKERSPTDRHTISQAETELKRAGVDAARSSRTLEEEMETFEKKKLEDIKKILQDFVQIELIYHAKALEMYTVCFQNLADLDENEDLEEFRNSLRPTYASARSDLQRAHSRTSLTSTGGMNGTSHSRGTTPGAQRRNHLGETRNTAANTTGNTTVKSSMYSEEYGTTTGKSSMYSSSTGHDEEEEEEEDEDEDEYIMHPQRPAVPVPHSPYTPKLSSKRRF